MPTATGSNNAAIGYQAGNAMTTGVGNTLIGASSGDSINSGNNNVSIGYEAGSTLTAGEQNTFVGYQAGLNANPSTEAVVLVLKLQLVILTLCWVMEQKGIQAV